jgi:hypothetical protein
MYVSLPEMDTHSFSGLMLSGSDLAHQVNILMQDEQRGRMHG